MGEAGEAGEGGGALCVTAHLVLRQLRACVYVYISRRGPYSLSCWSSRGFVLFFGRSPGPGNPSKNKRSVRRSFVHISVCCSSVLVRLSRNKRSKNSLYPSLLRSVSFTSTQKDSLPQGPFPRMSSTPEMSDEGESRNEFLYPTIIFSSYEDSDASSDDDVEQGPQRKRSFRRRSTRRGRTLRVPSIKIKEERRRPPL